MEGLRTSLESGPPRVLHVAGEIDLATADQLRVSLLDALATDPVLVIDMADVTFIDATGLRAVLQAAQSTNGGAPLTLVHAPLVARLLELVGGTCISYLEIRESG